jgi:hypothetical protein
VSRDRVKPPGNLQGLERWIGEWASNEVFSPGRLRRRIGLIALVAMIDAVQEGEPTFVFKGGAAFELRFGNRARSTSDVDAVFRGNLEDSVTFLQRALAQGWSGFGGSLVDKGTFDVPGVRTSPRRSIAKLTYVGKPFLSLPIEVAAPEADALTEIDHVLIAPLKELGFGAPGPVPLLGVPYQIAQKLHACTTPDTEDHRNERAHDLADLILLDELGTIDLARTKEACLKIFEHRRMHEWPPTILVRPNWEETWRQIVADDNFPIATVSEAATLVRQLVERIDAAHP